MLVSATELRDEQYQFNMPHGFHPFHPGFFDRYELLGPADRQCFSFHFLRSCFEGVIDFHLGIKISVLDEQLQVEKIFSR